VCGSEREQLSHPATQRADSDAAAESVQFPEQFNNIVPQFTI
jgi:hypothetical protein